MKSGIILLFSILVISGCNKDSNNVSIDGLSLYWDHEVFGEEGRRLRFEFYGTNEFENSYELFFNYSIDQKTISITLHDIIDKGKCPMVLDRGFDPTIDSLCSPGGRMSIPDSLLFKGTYTLTLKTPDFETTSELIVGNDSITLHIPSNAHFSSSIHAVYPIPVNLLFGGIVYSGDENTGYALNFLDDLLTLGLIETKVPDYPYRHLSVNEDRSAIDSQWPPDNHSLGFIYMMTDNFKEIFELAERHFNKANINIYLYSSQGDQAILNQIDGITVVYAN